jgi:hypothetical protein
VTSRLERKIRFKEKEFSKDQNIWRWLLNESEGKEKRRGHYSNRKIRLMRALVILCCYRLLMWPRI